MINDASWNWKLFMFYVLKPFAFCVKTQTCFVNATGSNLSANCAEHSQALTSHNRVLSDLVFQVQKSRKTKVIFLSTKNSFGRFFFFWISNQIVNQLKGDIIWRPLTFFIHLHRCTAERQAQEKMAACFVQCDGRLDKNHGGAPLLHLLWLDFLLDSSDSILLFLCGHFLQGTRETCNDKIKFKNHSNYKSTQESYKTHRDLPWGYTAVKVC